MPQGDIVNLSRKWDRYETGVVRAEKPKPSPYGEKIDHDYSGAWDGEDGGDFAFVVCLLITGIVLVLLVASLAIASRGRISRRGKPIKHTPRDW